jgi:hypothetical protein
MHFVRFHILANKFKELFKRKPPKSWPYKNLQLKWVLKISDEVLAEAFETKMRSGMRLYCLLPGEAQKIVNTVWFDPYNTPLGREALEHWLWNHVFFNKYGEVVILHDYGKILWTVEDLKIDPMFDMVYKDQFRV